MIRRPPRSTLFPYTLKYRLSIILSRSGFAVNRALQQGKSIRHYLSDDLLTEFVVRHHRQQLFSASYGWGSDRSPDREGAVSRYFSELMKRNTKHTVSQILSRIPRRPRPCGRGSDRSRDHKGSGFTIRQ